MNKMKVKVISVFMVLILMSGFFIPIIAEGAEKGRKAVDGLLLWIFITIR